MYVHVCMYVTMYACMYVLHIQAWYAAFGARDMVEQSCKDFPNKVEVCDFLLFVCKIMFVY